MRVADDVVEHGLQLNRKGLGRVGRLRRNDEVLAVIRRGKKYRTPYALVYTLPSRQVRFTCVVGKKVSRSAVIRHRIQRQLREIMREALSSTDVKYDIVLIAIPPIVEVESYDKLRQAVNSVLKNLQ